MRTQELNDQLKGVHDSTTCGFNRGLDGVLSISVVLEAGSQMVLEFPSYAAARLWGAGAILPAIIECAVFFPDISSVDLQGASEVGIEARNLLELSRSVEMFADSKWCVFFTVSYGDPFAVFGMNDLSLNDLRWAGEV